jgi:flagellin-like hook-associated protein FlgL
MSNNIVLSPGVRQNLLALQNTASLSALTQNRLATGKKVNSALDNPLNYFVAQSLNDRAGDLNTLLDSISQATQTLKAADQGITSLTTLVQSAKAIATQALQTAKGTVNYTNVTGSVALGADTTQVTSTSSVATAGTVSVQSSLAINANGISTMTATDTIAITLGGTTHTFTKVAANNSNAANGTFEDAATLVAAINHANGFGGSNAGVALATTANGAVTVTAYDVTQDFSHVVTDVDSSGSIVAGNYVDNAHSLGTALTISDGTNTHSYYRVASGGTNLTSNALGVYSDGATLKTSIDASNLVSGGNATTTNNANIFTVARADGGQLTFSGGTALAAGLATSGSGTSYQGNYNAQLASLTGDITVQVGANAAHTITFGTGSGQVNTRSELNALLATYNDLTGSVDSSGNFNLAPTSTDNITIGGTAPNLAALGLNSGITTPSATVITPNATRASLQTDFNNLLIQIDQLSRDSGYNGINLIAGDSLKVVFNSDGSSSMNIGGVRLDAVGIGLSTITGAGFQDNKVINDTLTAVGDALASLRSHATQFGSNLTVVQTRQDFTKNLVTTLQSGADALVLADTNEEGANLLALQTRQQLSTTALSMANQASQAVLRLFG